MKPLLFLADRYPDGSSRNLIPVPVGMMILAGGTGSGKTRAAARLVSELAYTPNARAWVVSYKYEDLFAPLLEVPNARVYMGGDSLRGLQDYYNSTFKARMEGDKDRSPAWLLLDEVALMIMSLPRAEAQMTKDILTSVLVAGRSLSCWAVCGVQRAAAELFSGSLGAKDNFQTRILFGNATKMGAEVLEFDKSAFLPVKAPGEGHILLNGIEQIPCRVAANLGDEYIMRQVMEDVKRVVTR